MTSPFSWRGGEPVRDLQPAISIALRRGIAAPVPEAEAMRCVPGEVFSRSGRAPSSSSIAM